MKLPFFVSLSKLPIVLSAGNSVPELYYTLSLLIKSIVNHPRNLLGITDCCFAGDE